MAKSVFKILTFIALHLAVTLPTFADVLDQTELKTHLRWKINVQKEQVQIKKRGTSVEFKSLDPEFFEQLSTDITKLKKNTNYISDFKFAAPEQPGNPYVLTVDLKDDSIELFSFYKDDNSQYVLDYWINQDVVATKNASISAKPRVVSIVKKKKSPKKVKVASTQKILTKRNSDKFKVIDPNKVKREKDEAEYRDFRYGAAFVWDYKALIPNLEQDVNLAVKAPDFLYSVLDRRFQNDDKEAHVQLNINFYKQEKWGLMTRSISLYEEKYGTDKFKALNDFMKATSMIKNSIKSKVDPKYAGSEDTPKSYSDKGVRAAARNMLSNVLDRTTDYNLAKGVLRYLIQHYRDEADSVNALEHAKKLYVKASSAYDDDMIVYSSRVILNSLANLAQLSKIDEFLKNKAVARVLSSQEGLAYRGFIHLVKGETKQVITEFKAAEKSLAKPIHPSILYNTAEAYFREAGYSNSIKLFDQYVSSYSFSSQSGNARLRMALAFDLDGRDADEVLKLYKDAINKTSDLSVRYEAKIRYVGYRGVRKRELSDEDTEILAFLEGTEAEKKTMTDDHKKLLWLTRLRSFINTGKYDEALAYLTTLPLDSIKAIEKRTFQADGAEIVLGIIQKAYLSEDFGRAVKVWELYKSKYETKVAKSPYMAFIVSDSFLKLGLTSSFERSVQNLEALKSSRARVFPRWVKAHKDISVRDYIVELNINKLIQNNDYTGLKAYLKAQAGNKNINYKYYNGLVSYKLKAYNDSVTSFESILVTPNKKNYLTPNQSLTMFESYLESLYQSASGERFRKNAAALSNDLRVSDNKNSKVLLERANYLYLESLFAEKDIDYLALAKKSAEFIGEHKDSQYISRINFLNGVSEINIGNVDAGKKVLNNMITQEGVPEYLKGLARSELSTLVIKEKRI